MTHSKARRLSRSPISGQLGTKQSGPLAIASQEPTLRTHTIPPPDFTARNPCRHRRRGEVTADSIQVESRLDGLRKV